jgi:hypothetical protein
MSKDQGNQDNKKLKSVSLFMERFWLGLAIVSFIVVCYFFIVDGVNAQTLQMLVFPLLAGLMYGFRSFFRQRLEKGDDRF